MKMFRNKLGPWLRSGARKYYTVNSSRAANDPHIIAKQIYSQIKATGPITVAEYMRQVLVHPLGGYYMSRDVFGAGGDFVTSPELGQIFGEMLAVWFLNEWSKLGSPKPFQIVELGPGRGTLCQDILRVFNHFKSLQGTTVHLVEVSELLADLQAKRLCTNSHYISDANSAFYREGISFQGVPIRWYRNLKDVPKAFTLLVAHEFFDALPIHKFEKTEKGFREILIDIEPELDLKFRYVMAREETPAVKLLCDATESRRHFETSPETLIVIRDIAERVELDGGLCLIADYGHGGEGTDTFRAFKKHKLHDPLIDPGTADLTADVDFAALNRAAQAQGGVLTFGPVTQRDFLLRMGIEQRVGRLAENIDAEQKKALEGGFRMMTDADQMGDRFKFVALFPAAAEKILTRAPVVGFH